MKKISLQNKIVFLTVTVCIVLMALFSYTIYKLKNINTITTQQLNKIEKLSELSSTFRLIRINIRSLAVSGNTAIDQQKYIAETKDSIREYLEQFENLRQMAKTEEQKKDLANIEAKWDEFLSFGKRLLSKYENPTEVSLKEGSRMIREECPIIATKWMEQVKIYLANENKLISIQANDANAEKEKIENMSILLFLVTALVSILLSYIFSKKISFNINNIANKLKINSSSLAQSSNLIANTSHNLSKSAIEQASSLQQTVSSMDEINSMIDKNSDAANSSTTFSKKSNTVALKGKQTVTEMISSINEISSATNEIASEMQKNSEDINNILTVISNIGEKTKIINDIVFQTKLLSFNASVEAARAGEHGKGFSVVAEEVGKLAQMSGKASEEIGQLLEQSIGQVKAVVDSTKNKVQILTSSSKSKVDLGNQKALECGIVLDEILENVVAVNNLINEIAVASNEQSMGVREISKAMQELDHATHENTTIAKESANISSQLKQEASSLEDSVLFLLSIVNGEDADSILKNNHKNSSLNEVNEPQLEENSIRIAS